MLRRPAPGSGGGFTETAPGSGIYTVSGLTVASADTALDNVQFTPANNTGPSGTFNTDLSVTVNDQGGGGVAGIQRLTIAFVITSPIIAAVFLDLKLWLPVRAV